MKNQVEGLISYLEKGTSPFQVVQACVEDLEKAGYAALKMEEPWELQEGGKYFVCHHGTTLLAFCVPAKEAMIPRRHHVALRVAAAHTDFPCFSIKPNPDMETKGFLKLNTEVYGGPILNTWLDRPLGVAGRVAVATDCCLEPELRFYDSVRPILTIPNLAIHMNRDVNKGVELNKQTMLLPLFGKKEENWDFMTFLADELQVKKEDILDYQLYVYNAETPAFVGGKEEFLSAPRIDNISSCRAIIEAMCQIKEAKQLNIGICYDHEEIGSRTKQGAGSAILTDVIEKIYEAMGFSARQGKDAIYQGLMLSADVAHSLHPNYVEKNDVTNEPVMNEGFIIKEAAAQSYATDAEAIAIVEQMARKHKIPYQKFVNRSDIPGGGTLGAISSALLPMRTVDVGVAILGMHSARELMGTKDYAYLRDIVCALYEEK